VRILRDDDRYKESYRPYVLESPIVRRVSRSSLAVSLRQTRDAVRGGVLSVSLR
jgi:hypothetical protein